MSTKLPGRGNRAVGKINVPVRTYIYESELLAALGVKFNKRRRRGPNSGNLTPTISARLDAHVLECLIAATGWTQNDSSPLAARFVDIQAPIPRVGDL